MSRLLITLCFCIGIVCCSAVSSKQLPVVTVEDTNDVIAGQIAYIKEYRELAVKEMLESGIPASVKLAQGVLETQYGTSILATQGNNHFGIKCKIDWTGDRFYADDDAVGECFRKYAKVADSYADHSNFLKYNRLHFYDKLFEIPIDDYKAWCQGLQDCGYATAVTYARSLVKIIERYKLYELDAYALTSKREIVTYSEVSNQGDTVTVEPVKKAKITCVHIVRKGETLNKIAKIYDMTAQQIIYLNNYSKNEVLQIGQAIKLN